MGIAVFLFVIAGAAVIANDDSPKSSVTVPEPVFDAGTVIQGEILKHSFTIINSGDTLLEIKKVATDCTCTATDYDKVIPPKSRGTVEVKRKTGGYQGKISGVTSVTTNSPTTPEIELILEAVVIPAIKVTPNRVFLNGFSDEKPEQIISIQAQKEAKLECRIVDVSKELTGLKYEMVPVKEGTTYRLKVRNTQKTPGSYRGRLFFTTNYREKPAFIVPVLVRVLDDIQVTPKKLEITRKNKKNHQDVWIKLHRGDSLKLTRVDIPEDIFRSSHLTEVEKGKRYRIRLEPKTDFESSDTGNYHVIIHTDHPHREKIDIPIEMKLSR